jgi:hypothetical protein
LLGKSGERWKREGLTVLLGSIFVLPVSIFKSMFWIIYGFGMKNEGISVNGRKYKCAESSGKFTL